MRTKGWEKRLIRAMEDQRDLPFAWGSSDCGHLMGAAINASMPGHPILDVLTYTNKLDALKLIKSHGSTAELLGEHFDEIPVLSARDGDVGTIVADDKSVGCVVLDGVAVCKSDEGTYRVPVSTMTHAFRVE